MSIIPAITSAIGIVGQINANREAQRRERAAAREAEKIRKYQEDDFNRRLSDYQNRVARGEFNPDEAIALNNEIVAREVRTGVGNLQGGMIGAGYKFGDTPLETRPAAISEKGRLALAQMNQNTIRQARGDQQQALAFASPSNLNAQLGSLQNDQIIARQSQGDIGGLIANMAPFFTQPAKKKQMDPYQLEMAKNAISGVRSATRFLR